MCVCPQNFSFFFLMANGIQGILISVKLSVPSLVFVLVILHLSSHGIVKISIPNHLIRISEFSNFNLISSSFSPLKSKLLSFQMLTAPSSQEYSFKSRLSLIKLTENIYTYRKKFSFSTHSHDEYGLKSSY